MATVTVDQAKLVLNSFAAIFQNNLVCKDLVTWKKFDNEMNDRNGLTVVEQISPDYTTTFTNSVVQDLSGGVQDTTFGSEQYKLSQVIGSSMGWADFVKIRDIGDARESEALKRAALRLAIDIDAYILGFAAKASNNLLGDGISSVSAWDDVASGYTRLKEEGVEDMDLRAVLTYGDKQALGKDIVESGANSGDNLNDLGEGMYRQGFSGKVAGIDTLFTQQLPILTTGTRTTASALTAGTTQAPVTYESVAISPAPGQYMTQLISVNVTGATATVSDGEVFTIAGLFAWDARAKKQLGHLQQFRVIGAATAAASVASLRIFPAIITVGPFKTVSVAPANTAVVTFVGAPSTALAPRFIANKSAVIVNTADLIMPATGMASRKALTKIPVSVRMWQDSVFATGEHRVRFDVALEANVVDRRRLVRING
jgi:hypothetical protein